MTHIFFDIFCFHSLEGGVGGVEGAEEHPDAVVDRPRHGEAGEADEGGLGSDDGQCHQPGQGIFIHR